MALRIRLNTHSGEPLYRQIVEQVKYHVACGRLVPGEQLPSIRALAGELKINPRTVVRSYEELQHAGLVVMRHGQGVFVSENRGPVPVSVRRRTLEELARRLIAEASRLGASRDDVLDVVEKISKEMDENQ